MKDSTSLEAILAFIQQTKDGKYTEYAPEPVETERVQYHREPITGNTDEMPLYYSISNRIE